MTHDDVSSLTLLGNQSTQYTYDEPRRNMLETFPNKCPDRDYWVNLVFPEFTSLCPRTGQPDFATIVIRYVPDQICVESKSLKLYFFAFRNYGSFMETITNKILDDFVGACSPRKCQVTGKFNARGGLEIVVETSYEKSL